MHAICGECANVNPPMLGVVGLPGHLGCYYEENGKEYDKEGEEMEEIK